MNADMKWLDDPEVFRVNQLDAHSDHCYYIDYADMEKSENPLMQSLNGQWEFAFSKNVMDRPENFYEENFDASSFAKIMVPGISNWQAMTKYAISIRCIRGREKNITGVRIVWRVPGTRQECFPRQSIILSDLISNDLI